MDEATLAELIASTAPTTGENKDWFTSGDLAKAAGHSTNWALGILRKACAKGLIVGERRISRNMLGERQSVPMYRMVKTKARGRA